MRRSIQTNISQWVVMISPTYWREETPSAKLDYMRENTIAARDALSALESYTLLSLGNTMEWYKGRYRIFVYSENNKLFYYHKHENIYPAIIAFRVIPV